MILINYKHFSIDRSLILNQVPGETEVWKSLEAISPNKKNDPTNLEEIGKIECLLRLN